MDQRLKLLLRYLVALLKCVMKQYEEGFGLESLRGRRIAKSAPKWWDNEWAVKPHKGRQRK